MESKPEKDMLGFFKFSTHVVLSSRQNFHFPRSAL